MILSRVGPNPPVHAALGFTQTGVDLIRTITARVGFWFVWFLLAAPLFCFKGLLHAVVLGWQQMAIRLHLINSSVTSLDEFTVYFDVTKYTALSVANSSSWMGPLAYSARYRNPSDGYSTY